MNVNQKGTIGLVEVIRDLTKKGYECFTPIHDYSAVDLVVMRDDHSLCKLQVKYRTAGKNGVVEVKFRTTSMGKHSPIDFDAIDGWAIYCPEIDRVTYISKNDCRLDNKGLYYRIFAGDKTVNKNKNAVPMYDTFAEISAWKITH